jgi:hypothetical protein
VDAAAAGPHMSMVTELDLWAAVKAYPVMDASSMSEAVCVAGVSASEPRRRLRLFPLNEPKFDSRARHGYMLAAVVTGLGASLEMSSTKLHRFQVR